MIIFKFYSGLDSKSKDQLSRILLESIRGHLFLAQLEEIRTKIAPSIVKNWKKISNKESAFLFASNYDRSVLLEAISKEAFKNNKDSAHLNPTLLEFENLLQKYPVDNPLKDPIVSKLSSLNWQEISEGHPQKNDESQVYLLNQNSRYPYYKLSLKKAVKDKCSVEINFRTSRSSGNGKSDYFYSSSVLDLIESPEVDSYNLYFHKDSVFLADSIEVKFLRRANESESEICALSLFGAIPTQNSDTMQDKLDVLFDTVFQIDLSDSQEVKKLRSLLNWLKNRKLSK